MLAEKLHGTDPEDVILDAFKEFDENNTGFIPKVPFPFIKFHKIHKKIHNSDKHFSSKRHLEQIFFIQVLDFRYRILKKDR